MVFVLNCCISSYTSILTEIEAYEELLCNRSYEIKGKEEGSYGLEIISVDNENSQIIEFKAIDIPISTGEIHQYAVDWTLLQANERGVALKIDSDGNGMFDQFLTAGNELYDIDLPEITLGQIENEYLLNSQVKFEFSASDKTSGIASIAATLNGIAIENNQAVVLNKVGLNFLEITATDNTGNSNKLTRTFNVVYKFTGFLPPIEVDGSGVYKQDRTLPTKFRLIDSNNNYVSTAIAHISLAKFSNNIYGDEEILLSTSAADTGNQFRYDATENQYIFNLSTKSLTAGSWQLKVKLDDGKQYYVQIAIKN